MKSTTYQAKGAAPLIIDYLAPMLVNMTAGLVLLACWIFFDAGTPQERRWVPGFAMSGLVALLLGLHMTLSWPLPGNLNTLFGEASLFFGVLLLGLAFVTATGMGLLPIALYAAAAGLAAVLTGVQVLNLSLTSNPALFGAGLISLGAAGLLSLPMLRFQSFPAFRIFGAAGFLIAAILWGAGGYTAYWHHAQQSANWQPPTTLMEGETQK